MKRFVRAALFSSLLFAPTLAAAQAPSSAAQPYRLEYLEYASTPQQVQMDAGILADAAAHVQSVVDAGTIDGAVFLVARHGKVVLHQSFGRRDGNFAGSPTENPVMPADGIFDVQSVTKLFTAFLAVELHDEGKLSLSAPVAQYLPEFATPEKSGILVRDLVRFTSGHPVDTAAYLVGDNDPWSTILAQSLLFPPNTRVLYSDIGYRLLGRVVEVAGNAPLDVQAQNRIFGPLGMVDTAWRPLASMPGKQPRFVGTGYSTSRTPDGSPRYMRGEVADEQDYWIEDHTDFVTGCDGAFSTAWDLALFGQLFLNRGARVIGTPSSGFCLPGMSTCQIAVVTPPPLVEGMMSLQSKDASDTPLGISGVTSSWLDDLLFANKGYGWELADTVPGAHVVTGLYSSQLAVSKIGGAGTFITVDPDPSRDLVVVLLTNHGLPSFVGPDGIGVDANGNTIWPGYENMLNGIGPDLVNDLVQLSITD